MAKIKKKLKRCTTKGCRRIAIRGGKCSDHIKAGAKKKPARGKKSKRLIPDKVFTISHSHGTAGKIKRTASEKEHVLLHAMKPPKKKRKKTPLNCLCYGVGVAAGKIKKIKKIKNIFK